MDTRLSDEQRSLEDACEDLLRSEWPLERALAVYGRAGEGEGHSPALWRQLAATGSLGLPFSESVGGAQADLVDLGLAYRAAGYSLVPSTLSSCMFAQLLIDKIGSSEQAAAHLPPIIQGASLATVAFSEPHATDDIGLFKTTAERVGGSWVLRGTKAFVRNLDTAEQVLVLARVRAGMEDCGHGLFIIPTVELLSFKRQNAMGSERFFTMVLEGIRLPQEALLGGDQALPTTRAWFEDVREIAAALQCMEATGGIRCVLDRTVEYVKVRQVQGRPVGANQAVQHMLANLWIQLNGVRVASLKALWAKSQGASARREVAIAKIAVGRLYGDATITAHQLWGAMGYARETGIHLWSERARVTQALFGTRRFHEQQLAECMGLGKS
jgi:3-oxocholest-4-en-26-oyl-CoA dehydrogenase beta subunit